MRKRRREHRDYGDAFSDCIAFRKLVTPKLFIVIHAVVLAAAAFGTVGEFWWGLTGGGDEHYLMAGACVFGYLIARVTMEGGMVLYLIYESLGSVSEKLESVDDRLRLLNKRAGADK